MKADNKNTPALRFPEFKGEWVRKTIGEEISFLAGYAFDSSMMSNEAIGFQIIKMSNVYQNELRLDRNPSFWKVLDANQQKFLLEVGDVVLTLTGTVGKRDYGYSIIVKESGKYVLNQRLVRLRGKEGKTHNGFILYLVTNDRFLYYFFANSKGGTGNQSNVSIEDIKTIKLNLPHYIEQQKIADFLTAVDERIQQLTKKKVLLEQYKKGVMQKLFSQEIRFKDEHGNDYPDWEEKRLGEILAIKSGDSPSNYKLVKTGELPYLKVEDLNNSTKYQAFSREYSNDDPKNNLVPSNSIIFPKRGAAILTNKVRINVIPVLLDTNLMAITPIPSILNYEYLYYVITFVKLYKIADTSTIPQINNKHIIPYKIQLPNVSEQKKNADFLSSIDNKIEQVQKEIDKTNAFKKGLLQQMFV